MLVGIVVGSYSSIFVAAALVAWMKEREEQHLAVARKVAARGADSDGTRMVSAEDAALGTVPSRPTADRPRPGGAPPRPRKKKKR